MAHVRVDIPKEDLKPDFVREAVAGRVDRLPPSVALALISQLEIPQQIQQELLLEVLGDTKLDWSVRVAAVRLCMRFGVEKVGSHLLKALDSSEERIAAAAAAALGQVGTPDHLSALKRKREGGDLNKRRVSFAETLIVHRYGLKDEDIQFPHVEAQVAPDVGGQAFVGVRPGPERRARALEGIKREFPSIDAARQDVYEIQCGPRLMEVAVDRSLIGPDDAASLAMKPALPAMVAFQDLEYDEFYARYVLLSRPSGKDHVAVMITTLTGDPVYIGEGTVSGGAAEFELRAARSPGIAPVLASIRLSGKGVEIAGVSDRTAQPRQVPSRMSEK